MERRRGEAVKSAILVEKIDNLSLSEDGQQRQQ